MTIKALDFKLLAQITASSKPTYFVKTAMGDFYIYYGKNQDDVKTWCAVRNDEDEGGIKFEDELYMLLMDKIIAEHNTRMQSFIE